MAAINRAYTSEYSTLGQAYQPGQWAYPVPETNSAAPKVKRTRQRPELETKAQQADTAHNIRQDVAVPAVLSIVADRLPGS